MPLYGSTTKERLPTGQGASDTLWYCIIGFHSSSLTVAWSLACDLQVPPANGELGYSIGLGGSDTMQVLNLELKNPRHFCCYLAPTPAPWDELPLGSSCPFGLGLSTNAC